MRRFSCVTPAHAARAILDAMFARSGQPTVATHDRAHRLAPFQLEAVLQAEQILRRHGGVLIADPVGMGKTWVGAALAGNAIGRRLPTLVVVPAPLRRYWATTLKPIRGRNDDAAAPLLLATHTDLSRDGGPETDRTIGRVIIDEAHAFRNPNTRRYAALARLSRAAEVVLLTATPINNSLLDLYFLIRLFAGDGAFADLGVPDLQRLFRMASLAPDATPAPAMGAVLRAITIRRTRAEVGTAHLPNGMRFPERAAPHTVRYDTTPQFALWLENAIRTIEELRLPPYSLHEYGVRHERAGAAPLLRLILAKRLESGTAAFGRSIADLARRTTEFRDALRRGLLRPPRDAATSRENGEQLLLEELLFQPLPPGLERHRLLHDCEQDLVMLNQLIVRLAETDDPKTAALHELLFSRIANQRALVFTEFRDTAADLWRRFAHHGGIGAIHGSAAWLGNSPAHRMDVIRRFAPRANHSPEPPPHEAVRVLFATDVLAEGLNLQDAAHIVSYDLPWNPVRLIQRVGRIDRLGSHHHTIHAYHFLPAAGLEPVLGLVERLRHKLAAIRAGLAGTSPRDATPATAAGAGLDDTPCDADTRGLVERLASGDPTLLDDLDRLDAAPLQDTTRLHTLWRSLPPQVPPQGPETKRGRADTPLLVAAIPGNITLGQDPPAAIVALENGGLIHLFETHDHRPATPAGPAAAAILESALSAPHTGTPAADPGPDRLGKDQGLISGIDSWKDKIGPVGNRSNTTTTAERHIRQAIRAAGRPGRPSPRTHTNPAAKALRLLRRTAAATPGGPDSDFCTRIDHIATTLATGLRAGTESALQDLLARSHWNPPTNAATLCSDLESVLRTPPAAHSPTPPSRPRPVAIILITKDAH